MFDVVHPIFDVSSPLIAEIQDRTDEGAREILDEALRLAAWRIGREQTVASTLREIAVHPNQDIKKLSFKVREALTPTDLLRAILVCFPGVFEDLIGPDHLSERFDADVEHWRKVSDQASDSPRPDRLSHVWGRRWAFRDALYDSPPVDVDCFLRSLTMFGYDCYEFDYSPDVFALYYSDYLEGDWGLCEIEDRYFRALNQQLSATPPFEEVPPAYFDANNKLDELENIFEKCPRILLISDRGTGKSALLEAWALRQRIRLNQGQRNARNVRINPFVALWEGNRPEWPTKFADKPFVLGISPNSEDGFYSYASHDSSHSTSGGLLACELIEFFGALSETSPDCVGVVAAATPKELEVLRKKAPVIESFERVELSPMADRDHVPIWLCHSMERSPGQLAVVIECLRSLGDLVGEVRPWKIGEAFQAPATLFRFEPIAIGTLKQIRRRLRPGRENAWYQRFVGDERRLDGLIQVDAKLRGL